MRRAMPSCGWFLRTCQATVTWTRWSLGLAMQKKTSGATTTILKPAYEPSLFFPFAAPPVHGSLADSGELFESYSPHAVGC